MATRILKITNRSCVIFLLGGADGDPHTLQVPMTGTGHFRIKRWEKPAANICPSSVWREASVRRLPPCCTFAGQRLLICSSQLVWCHPDSTLSGSGFKAHWSHPHDIQPGVLGCYCPGLGSLFLAWHSPSPGDSLWLWAHENFFRKAEMFQVNLERWVCLPEKYLAVCQPLIIFACTFLSEWSWGKTSSFKAWKYPSSHPFCTSLALP